MNFFRGSELPVSFALLTQRVSLDVAVTDSLPSSAVASSCLWIPLVFFVSSRFLLLMLLTKSSLYKLGAAGVRAGALRFSWHQTPPA